MKQPRSMSVLEAITNTLVGLGLALALNLFILPLFGLYPTLLKALEISVVFTVASIVRSYTLRRLFEEIRVRGYGTRI